MEIISRDRGGSYAEAARLGAPEAIQVCDRWHLLKNLGDAVERFLFTRHEVLAAVGAAVMQEARQGAEASASPGRGFSEIEADHSQAEASLHPPTRAEQQRQVRRQRRQQRYEQVRALAEAGKGKRAIARETGLSRVTVRKYLAAESFPEIAQRKGTSAVDSFLPYLQQRWEAGCRNATQLWREIQHQGYRGSAVMVRLKVRGWRESDGRKDRHKGGEPRKPLTRSKPPSPRRAMWLLLGDEKKRTPEEAAMRGKLLEMCAEVRRVTALALEFQEIVRARKVTRLEKWLGEAQGSGHAELMGLARGIMQDRAAVEAALKHEWSNGQVEGQVNRIKAIKRAMYGRAKFDLLRRKILLAG